MKRFLIAALGVMLVVGLAPAVSADVLPINLVSGNWTNAVPSVTIDNTGATHTARWGTPAGGAGQSGYDWTSRTTPFNITTGTPFDLGEFVHQNFPITGTVLSSIELAFSVQIDGLTALTGTFYFTHDETPNALPCAYSSVTPCADRVTVSSPLINAPFTYLGVDYFFSLLGFSNGLPVNLITQFITQENQSNAANLYAIITTEPTGVVPEPTSMLLLGTGLVGLAHRLRRKQ